MAPIISGGLYRHYKNNKLYKIITIARHSETQEEMVIYKGLYECEQFGWNPIWARPAKMFLETVQLDDGKAVPRFVFVSN